MFQLLQGIISSIQQAAAAMLELSSSLSGPL